MSVISLAVVVTQSREKGITDHALPSAVYGKHLGFANRLRMNLSQCALPLSSVFA